MSKAKVGTSRNRCAAVTMTVALAFPAFGLDPPRTTFTSMGEFSCAAWVAAREKEKSAPHDLDNSFTLIRMRGWILGYVTGLNEVLFAKDKDVLAPIDGETVFDWMDDYCAKHPGAAIRDGAVELLVAIRKLPSK